MLLSLFDVISRTTQLSYLYRLCVCSFPYSQCFVEREHKMKRDTGRERERAHARTEVQEESNSRDSCYIRSCAFFLYILHIYIHFQTTLFLFPFFQLIFSDSCLPYISVLLFLFGFIPFLSLSLLPSLLSTSRKHKRVRVFPIRFRPQLFFFFFFSLFFYLSTLARVDVFADAKCARTHTAYRKKKTEGEEDEQTYTIEKKRVMLSLNTILPFFPLFFNLRPVTAIYIYIYK